MNITDIRLPVSITSDVDYINIQANATTYKLNVRAFAPEGVGGNNVNIMGTKEIATLGTGATLVGWCEDVQNKALILFIKASIDKIVRYNLVDESIQNLNIPIGILNFQENHWINADVVGDMLYWTDGYFTSFEGSDFNPPRKINMVKALAESYTTINSSIIDAAKATHTGILNGQYTGRLTCTYKSNSLINRNYLRDRLFQFRVQYVYDDKEKSAWSAVSKIALPVNESTPNGVYSQPENINNYIEIQLSTGNENVVSINVAYREGNFGNWRKFKTIEKYNPDGSVVVGINNNENYILDFYGNEVNYALDNTEVERTFHDVPFVAKKQKFIDGKNLIYANYYQDYPNVSGVTLTPSITKTNITYERNHDPALFVPGTPDEWHVYFSFLDDEVVVGNLISIYIRYYDGEGIYYSRNYFYTINTGDTKFDVASTVSDWFNTISEGLCELKGTISWLPENIHLEVNQDYDEFTIQSIDVYYSEPFTAQKTFKSGSNYEFGIVYYDRIGRCGGVNSQVSKYVPFFNEFSNTSLYSNPILHYSDISIAITGTPPDWATHYQIVSSPKQRLFFQYLVNPFTRVSGKVIIRLNDSIQIGLASNSKVSYGYYTFKKRDRIRVIGRRLTTGGFQYDNTPIDLEIIDVGYDEGDNSYKKDDATTPAYIVDADGNKIKTETSQYLIVKDFDFETAGLGTTGERPIIEVYSPETGDDNNNTFYEVGTVYAITNPHTATRLHASSTITLEGDVYVRPRLRDAENFFMCESTHFSDIYQSDYWDRGRSNVYIENAKSEWHKTAIKHSKAYLQNSINGLSDFTSDETILSEKFGEITALNESGYILQVKQDMKDTSIYIGRIFLNQPSDQQGQLTTTDKLLGSVNPSKFNYGTIFPKSVIQNGSYTYYFDVYNGYMIRDTYNGPSIISDFGMSTYFKEKSRDLLAAETKDVVCAWDGKYGELSVTFNIDGVFDTVVFHEKSNLWSHYSDLHVEGCAFFGDTLLSVKTDKLWLHNGNDTRNNFYGVQYYSRVKLIFNNEILKNKIFQSLQLKALGNWIVDNEGDITVLDESGTAIMSSYLPDSKFVSKEGGVYATFLRNMTSALSKQKLINGEVLRGRFLVVDLTCKDTDKAWLAHTVVKSIISEKS